MDEVILGSHEQLDKIRTIASTVDVVLNAADSDDLPLTKAIIAGLRIRSGSSKATWMSPLPILIHTSGTGVIADKAKGSFTDEAKKVWNVNESNAFTPGVLTLALRTITKMISVPLRSHNRID